MKNTKALRLPYVVAGLGALIATPSFAATDPYPYVGPYLGVGLGHSWSNIDDAGVSAKLLPAGGVTIRDEQDLGFKLFGGYQINPHLALEVGYFDLGTFGFKSTVIPNGTLKGQIDVRGFNLDIIGFLPLSSRWSAMGRIGAQHHETHDYFVGTGSVVVLNPDPVVKELNYKVGVGVQYAFDRNVRLRLEGERYRINDALSNHGDINMLVASLVLSFGRAPAPLPPPPPETVAVVVPPSPPPAPEPVVVPTPPPPPPPPPRRRVSFSADSLFGFDKSTIRPEGKAALDVFAEELKGTRFEVITVEGHTDRLGSVKYNDKLSLERAETVKTYLVNAGIDGTKITTVGKGESTPATDARECKGEKRSPELIACLQPNRRVEVEVVGSRRQ